MTRQYISLGIQELERIFAEHQEDTDVLKQLQAELARRTTERATRLRRRGEKRLGNIAGTPRQGDFFDGRAAGVKPKTPTDRVSTNGTPPVSAVTMRRSTRRRPRRQAMLAVRAPILPRLMTGAGQIISAASPLPVLAVNPMLFSRPSTLMSCSKCRPELRTLFAMLWRLML